MNTRLLTVLVGLILLGFATQMSAQLPAGAGGNYGGILEADAGGEPDNSGILVVVLRDSGASTIKLVWQGQVYPIKASFDATGQVTKNFTKKNDPSETELSLFCALNADTREIGGFLTDPTASSGGGFTLSGQPPDTAALAQLPAGLRVAFIEPPGGSTAEPEPGPGTPARLDEDGFALVTVARTARRSTRFVGALPDSTKYSAGSPARGLQYALRAGLYSQREAGSGGQLLGLGDASGSATTVAERHDPRGGVAQLIAALRWHKKRSGIRTNSYPDGFDQRVDLDTVVYNPDVTLRRVLAAGPPFTTQGNARLRLSGGNLGTDATTPGPNPITVAIDISFLGARVVGTVVGGVVVPDNRHRVSVRVNPLTARFNGSFRHPDTTETMKFKGAFRSFVDVVPGEGRGNFLSLGPAPRDDPSKAASGSVRITVN